MSSISKRTIVKKKIIKNNINYFVMEVK